MKDTYLFKENAGNQHVRRRATCHNEDATEFAISPAYFDVTKLEGHEKI